MCQEEKEGVEMDNQELLGQYCHGIFSAIIDELPENIKVSLPPNKSTTYTEYCVSLGWNHEKWPIFSEFMLDYGEAIAQHVILPIKYPTAELENGKPMGIYFSRLSSQPEYDEPEYSNLMLHNEVISRNNLQLGFVSKKEGGPCLFLRIFYTTFPLPDEET